MDIFILMLQSFVQGIVQGITEWLPVSSTGHILLLNAVWPMDVSKEFWDLFKVVIQLGSIMAVVVLYFRRLNPFSKKKTYQQNRETLSLWGKVIVGSIPVAAVGLLLNDLIDDYLSVPPVIAAALIIYGIGFIVFTDTRLKKPRICHMNELNYKTAIVIGLFEALALIPGTSRSGATILGALLIGVSRSVAAEFSFFMAIPAMLGASGLKFVKMLIEGVNVTAPEWMALIIATLVSFVVSLFAIRFLMGFIKKHDFRSFGYYRIALALIIIICLIAAPSIFAGVQS